MPESPQHAEDRELFSQMIGELNRRSVPDGGFGRSAGAAFDAVSTTWALLALVASGAPAESLKRGADRLARIQRPDGRIPVDPRFTGNYWLTSVFALVTSALPGFEGPGKKAEQLLLSLAGAHWTKKPGDPNGHDTSIPGWGWASDSHSWVDPTALAILALRIRGLENHDRVKQGIALLLDRQLARGGWNYGNTTVFGKPLDPTPESTGHALCALRGAISEERVAASLAYLAGEIQGVRTPLSLAWALLALSTWDRRPPDANEWIRRSLNLQSRYGPYDTALLAQLALAAFAPRGLLALLGKELPS